MTPAWYQAYGLLISSDLPLALPRAAEVGDTDADIVVQRGSPGELADAPLDREASTIVASYELADGRWYVAYADGDGYRIRFRDCGEFVIARDGAAIRWIPEPGERAALLPILFAGTVLAFVLTMRGHLVLHASAVAHDDRALAFAGQSGRGKSTMAALAAAAGARIVTDDVLLVDVDGPPRCRGSAGELRLRESARSLASSFTGGAGQRETADQRLALQAASTEQDWVHLGAVVVPRPEREATTLELRRLTSSEAALWLLAFPRVHGLRPAAVLQRQFALLGALVRSVPVYDATVPWGPPFRTDLAGELLELVVDREAC